MRLKVIEILFCCLFLCLKLLIYKWLADVEMGETVRSVERVVLPQPPPLITRQLVSVDQRHNLDAGRLGLEHDMVPIVLHGQVVDMAHQLTDIDPRVDMGTV